MGKATCHTRTRRKYSLLIILLILLSIYVLTIYYVDDILPKEVQPKLSLNENSAFLIDPLSKDNPFKHQDILPDININTSISDISSNKETQIDTSTLQYCPIKYHNTQIFTKNDLEQLVKQRTNPPTKICNEYDLPNRNTEWKRLNINNFPNNMLSYVNRCKLNIFTDNQEFTELWSNNQTSYNHLYKCGGTTIWNAMNQMQKDGLMNGIGIKYKLHKNDSFLLRDNDYYWEHEEYFYNYLNHNFFFTYIRDPIDRSLSSYYELAVKDTKILNQVLAKDIDEDNVKGIYRYRLLMNGMLNWKCSHLNKLQNINERKEQIIRRVWSGDPHIHPQMIHLLNHTFEWFPYNYIGNLSGDFDISFKMILDEFSDAYHQNKSLYYKYVTWARNRESGHYGNVLKEDVVTKNDLSDEDMKTICEIYWIDYICLPFDVPKACNISDL
eukprot:73067_1